MDDAERSEVLEELARARVGFGVGAGASAHRRSPTCGDEFSVQVDVVAGRISAVRWEGHGCVVSTAAAGVLASSAPGMTPRAFAELASAYIASVAPEGEPLSEPANLDVFAGIGRFPLRAGCATLAWRAALDALGSTG